jgi:hypothetical protein
MFQPSEVAHLGGTLPFTATDTMGTLHESAAVHITLDQVIDPGPEGPGSADPPPGHHNVELVVTVTNVGDVTVPDLDEGDPYILSIEWELNPDTANQDGVSVYQFEGLPGPTATCFGQTGQFLNGVPPGRSVTGCIPFGPVPDGTAVTGATALLLYAGIGNGEPGEWLIP